ncbi:MAG: hypothetical protein R8J85_08640 [Mariprofundales bacterium]
MPASQSQFPSNEIQMKYGIVDKKGGAIDKSQKPISNLCEMRRVLNLFIADSMYFNDGFWNFESWIEKRMVLVLLNDTINDGDGGYFDHAISCLGRQSCRFNIY